MSRRVWLFRSLLCAACAAAGLAGWLVYLQTNSAAVRAKVIDLVRADFPGVDVEIGSAWVRPLGGLWLRDVKLFRHDDPAHPFLVIPSATVYHDKEQLAQGRLVIRKVELTQPTVRLRRDADGNWNLPDLPRTRRGDGPVPMLVVRQGRVLYEDRGGGPSRAALEARDVQLTVINDPLPHIAFQGHGTTPLGGCRWSGAYERGPGRLAMTFDLPAYAVTPAVIEQLGGHFAEVRQHLASLTGQGDARLELRYQGGGKSGWQSDLRLNLRRGRFGHPRLPLSPLEDVELSARYRDGVLGVTGGRARAGKASLTFDFEATLPPDGPRPDDPVEMLTRCNLAVDRLTLSRELFGRLPPNLQKVHNDFKPVGPVGLAFKQERRGRWWSRRCIVSPEGITAEFVDFPMVMEGIRGKLEQVTTNDGQDDLLVSLTGRCSGRDVVIEGSTSGGGDSERIDLHLRGNGLTLDDNLRRALRDHSHVLEEFRPKGSGDFVARIRRNPGDAHTEIHVQVEFQDLAINHVRFPYPLERISGTAHVRLGGETRISFDDFQGRHNGGEVRLEGSYQVRPAGDELRVRVLSATVPFDSDLTTACTRVKLLPLLKEMHPSGRLGIEETTLTYTEWNGRQGAKNPPSRLEVACAKFTVDALLPDFLPYELTDVSGAFHFADDRVTMTRFRARHRSSQISMGGPDAPCLFILKREGGLWARLQRLQVAPLVPDEELLCALPPQLRAACAGLEASGPMSLTAGEFRIDTTADAPERPAAVAGAAAPARARLSPAPLPDEAPSPWMYWEDVNVRLSGVSLRAGLKCENVHGRVCTHGHYRNGHIGALKGNIEIDQAYVQRQPLQKVHAQLVMDPARSPGVLQIRNIKANLFGGQVAGEAALMLEPIVRYDVRLNGVGLKLEEVARYNRLGPDAELSGRAEVRLYLAGQGSDPAALRGGGTVHVPSGRIGNLPPLLDLLKFVKLRAPDGTFFEEAFANFNVEGRNVRFKQLDLVGNLISLTGEGRMKLDGSGVKLDIYPIWLRPVQALPSPLREVPTAVGRGLYKIEMTGDITGQLDLRSEIMPVVVEPARRLLDRLGGTAASR